MLTTFCSVFYSLFLLIILSLKNMYIENSGSNEVGAHLRFYTIHFVAIFNLNLIVGNYYRFNP